MCKCKTKKVFSKEFNVRWCPECITFYKPRKYTIHVFVLVLLIGLFSFKPLHHRLIKINKPVKDTIENIQLVDTCLIRIFTQEGVLFPEYAYKSCLLETGRFKSEFCSKFHNLFGISFCKSEYQIGWYDDGLGHKVAIYKNYLDCIKDYKRLQQYYAYNIDRKYSESKNYTKQLTKL